jgi:hypothetical protein
VQDCPDISACKRDASELHGKVEAQGSQITELEQVVKQLKVCWAKGNWPAGCIGQHGLLLLPLLTNSLFICVTKFNKVIQNTCCCL